MERGEGTPGSGRAAPGMVGVLQINMLLPGGHTAGGVLPVVVQVGSAASPAGVTIAVK